jgi:putative ABC transport system permease protein
MSPQPPVLDTAGVYHASFKPTAASVQETKPLFGGREVMLLRRRWVRWLDEANMDVRFALRSFGATPGITAVALLTITIGIGASAAMFSAMDAVLLRASPYATADRLVVLWERRPSGERNAMSTRSYRAYTDQPSLFERSAATVGPFGGVTLTGGESPVLLRAIRVGASYFDIFGSRALLGLTFVPGDDLPGRDHVIVLSHALWVSRFGSDRTLVGRSIQLDGEPYTVVGVMPPESPFDRSWIQVWMPLAFGPDRVSRNDHWIFSFTGGAVALLKPGVTIDSARAELSVVANRLGRTYPDSHKGWGVELEPYDAAIVGKDLRRSLYVLLGAV